jgi:hypothetical protein
MTLPYHPALLLRFRSDEELELIRSLRLGSTANVVEMRIRINALAREVIFQFVSTPQDVDAELMAFAEITRQADKHGIEGGSNVDPAAEEPAGPYDLPDGS